MIALARRFPKLRLALSLHSADAEKRRKLVPRTVGDLAVLKRTIQEINAIQNDTLWIEIALIDGVNDTREDARKLIAFCDGLNVEVNVIPYNDTSHAAPSEFRQPKAEQVTFFVSELRKAGIFTTHRKTLGDSIQAACGQLAVPAELRKDTI